MKHLIARTLASLTFVVAGLAVSSPAQSTHVLKANIPFEFNFGNQAFPAGEYYLVQPRQHYVVLRDSRGHYVAQALTGAIYSRTPIDGTALKFYSASGQYALAEIWQQQESTGERLYQPKTQLNVVEHRSTEASGTSVGGQP